jgi:hypothetical protein
MINFAKQFLFVFVVLFFFSTSVKAADSNYVTLVFPVRAPEYWRIGGDPKNFTNLLNLVKKTNLPSTWLLHYDVLTSSMSAQLKQLPGSEIGLFLEVTRHLAQDSLVKYDWEHNSWSSAYRVFLSGYELGERRRMIDKAFAAYKQEFSFYPSSYGAWYIDVSSLLYIKNKYGAKAVLGLADQYSTDGYQTWGQYLNSPYIVSKKSAIEPARNIEDSTGVVKLQWAPREPTLGLGNSVNSSNYSAQVNDYHRHKGLDIKYFQNLLEDITTKSLGVVSQAVIGIEVGELEEKYFPQMELQLSAVQKLVKDGKINADTMSGFSKKYLAKYQVSPPTVMGSYSKDASSWWYFDPDYRLGISVSSDSAHITDLRFYHHSDYADNDQTQKDIRQNLVRLVPAFVDRTVLNNDILITKNPVEIEKSLDYLQIKWSSGQIIASPAGILLPKILSEDLISRGIAFTVIGDNLKIEPPTPKSVTKKNCHDDNGGYGGRLSCLKGFIVWIYSFLPDFVYSNLDGQIYVGLRIGFENMLGFRLPKIKIGSFDFSFSTLENFISLKKKLVPDFSWEGKQELEAKPFIGQGTVYSKGSLYGQDELLKIPSGKKVFENSFYVIIADN